MVRRSIGAALIVFSLVPIYRILEVSDDTPHRLASVELAEATLEYVLWGLFVAVLTGTVLAFVVPPKRVSPLLHRAGARLLTLGRGSWALLLAAGGALGALAVNRFVYHGYYTNVDEIASAIQARYFAEGALAGKLPVGVEGWLIPNMLSVDAGWVSQFPPSHLALVALGYAAGAPWLVGPLLFGLLVGTSALVFPRLLPDRPRTARVAGLLVAVSPFLLSIGAGSLSHTSAGAFCMLAAYAALRARDGAWEWSALAGAAIGIAVLSRPWIGLLLGTVATLGLWLPALREGGRSLAWFAHRAAGTFVAGLPFAALLGWYNLRLFGSPTTFGYLAAFGERHKLGFHMDPWSQEYGLAEALGFTSTDLLAFGTQLLETPFPAGVAIGLWLLAAGSLPRGAGFLVVWAVVPIFANAVYWFHDIRMLYEGAPAWLALSALAVAALLPTRSAESAPETPNGSHAEPGRSEPAPPERRLQPRSIRLWSAVVSVVMAVVQGIPTRVQSVTWSDSTLSRITVPNPPDGRPALVFVHASWNERLASKLQGAGGMRQDSVMSVLYRNTSCELHEYTRARVAGVERLPTIDLVQQAGSPEHIVRPPSAEGASFRTRAGEELTAECARELASDRFGAVALAPLLWQGSLPNAENDRPMFVRDFGPETNEALVRLYPERTPWVYVPKEDGAAPELVAYDEAMRVLWGAAPAATAEGVSRPPAGSSGGA
jgi:hypothetical protein